MQETWVRSLGQADPQEKEVATHSSILAWEIPWMEEPGGYSPGGHKRVGQGLMTKNKELAQGHTSLHPAEPRFESVSIHL